MNYAEYRRDLNHCYMILKMDAEGEPVPEWQTGILEANRIPGLLPMAEEHIDNETCYSYDVTSVQPFDVFCRMKRIGKNDLKKMLVSLVTSLGALDDYLLDADHLLLDPDYLYIDGVAEELRIPYVPCRSRDIRESLRELMEYLLLRVDHEDQECVVFASRILHELKEANTEISDLPGMLTNDGLKRRPSGPEIAEPEKLLADVASEKKMRGGYGTGSDIGARGGASDECHGGARGTDQPGAVRQNTVRAVLAEEKRKLIPERTTVRIALAGAVVAAVVYLLLHAGILVSASPGEAALAAAAAAAAVLAAGIILARRHRRKNNHDPAQESEISNLPAMSGGHCKREPEEPSGAGQEELPGTDLSGGRLHDGFAGPGTDYGGVESEDDFRPDSVFQRMETGAGPGAYEDGSDETVCLSACGNPATPLRSMSAELVPAHSGTDLPVIRLEGKEILVGKHARAVDAVLPSGTVSRIHARLFMSGGEYYLSDLGSRNGTSVDGHMAVGNEEILLTDGADVKFADLEYVFRRNGGMQLSQQPR
ncbi:MAG: DUF6382 domain-containing protein [Chordicoccus sp.]